MVREQRGSRYDVHRVVVPVDHESRGIVVGQKGPLKPLTRQWATRILPAPTLQFVTSARLLPAAGGR